MYEVVAVDRLRGVRAMQNEAQACAHAVEAAPEIPKDIQKVLGQATVAGQALPTEEKAQILAEPEMLPGQVGRALPLRHVRVVDQQYVSTI
jgi:hypothetical protein